MSETGMVVTDLGAWDGEAPLLLTLPLPPNRANEGAGWHWRREHRLKQEYYLACLARYGKLPPPAPDMVRARVTLYTWNAMDSDNAEARMKFPLDWLQARGYIIDDSPKHLDLRVSQEIDRKNQRIEIELEGFE